MLKNQTSLKFILFQRKYAKNQKNNFLGWFFTQNQKNKHNVKLIHAHPRKKMLKTSEGKIDKLKEKDSGFT